MALMTTLNVYAINRTTVKTAPRTEGILTAQIKKVLSTRDVNGKWIGTNKPSNYRSIYTQVIVAKDDIAADTDNYYDNRTVAQVITAINS
jgi:phage-related tail protein